MYGCMINKDSKMIEGMTLFVLLFFFGGVLRNSILLLFVSGECEKGSMVVSCIFKE